MRERIHKPSSSQPSTQAKSISQFARPHTIQAQKADFTAQGWEGGSRFGHNFANSSLYPPDKPVSASVQPPHPFEADRRRNQDLYRQQFLDTARDGGMGQLQEAFPAITAPSIHPVQPLMAKMSIGQPGDKYEQEADRVASQVVEQINAPASVQSNQGQSVQRQEEAHEELQAKPNISELQMSPLSPEEKLEDKPEEEDIQAKLIIQRQAIAGGEASPDLTSAINNARGSGQPLDAGLQQSMGLAMGADFSGVKVHTDAQADQLNRSVQANAFTTGQDVFFRQGAYQPGSRGGQELIAHELTHVVQQNGGAISRGQVASIEKPYEAVSTPRQIKEEHRDNIQRTTYKYTSGQWQVQVSSVLDTDTYPDPNRLSVKPKEGDVYDQNTGHYTPNQALYDKVFEEVGKNHKKKFGGWYGQVRSDTAYSHLSQPKQQGPHSFSHIGKRTMAESSLKNNPKFDPTKLLRTGLMPSIGQVRALIKKEEKVFGKFPKEKKRSLFQAYSEKITQMREVSAEKSLRFRAAVEAMELNPLATYAHGRKATKKELQGKGERRKPAAEDLKVLTRLKKGDQLPNTLKAFDLGAISQHDQTDMVKFLRDIGTVAQGRPPSPLDINSEIESEDEGEEVDMDVEENEGKSEEEDTGEDIGQKSENEGEEVDMDVEEDDGKSEEEDTEEDVGD